MKIQLKNIKHSAFASQETHCYEASVYFDGKKAGTVGNQGHGGCDHEYPEDKEVWAAMQDYIDTLPPLEDERFGPMKQDLELICGELVNVHLVSKDLKRLLKKRVLYLEGDKIYQTQAAKRPAETLPRWLTELKDAKPNAIILNVLAFSEALELYRKHG